MLFILSDGLLAGLQLELLTFLADVFGNRVHVLSLLLFGVKFGQGFGNLLEGLVDMDSALGADLDVFDVFGLAVGFNFLLLHFSHIVKIRLVAQHSQMYTRHRVLLDLL